MKQSLKKLVVFAVCAIFFINSFAQSPPFNNKVKKQVIERIANELKNNYVYLDTALKMGNFIKQQFISGAYDTIKAQPVFAARLTADLLSVYHDGHLSIIYRPSFDSIGKDNPEAEKREEDRRLKFRRRVNFGFEKAEILPGNIGYLKIRGFFAPDKEAKDMTMAALRFVSNSNALIIDLRNNMGGEPEMVSYLCGFFFKNKTHLNDLYTRKDNSINAYWTTPDTLLKTLNTIPVYVLTNKHTFSAGEELTYDLQTQKRAIVIGETTGGGAHPVQPFSAGNGFVANIPFARAINPITKTNWEAIGVKPDIVVLADNALDTALSKIKTSGKQ